MKRYVALASALLLLGLSLALLQHAYGTYESVRSFALPNVEALSPEVTSRRVVNEILPLLPPGREGDVARTLLESQASEAAGLHKLWVTQAIATQRLASVQAVAWCIALVASLVLVVWHWRRRGSAA